MDQAVGIGSSFVKSLLERIEDEIGLHGATDAPAHDAPGEHVDDEGDIQPHLPSRNVGEVRHPQFIGAVSLEHPIDLVQWAGRAGVRARGADPPATTRALKPQAPHQPLDCATGHPDALTVHLQPDLVCTIDLPIGMPHALDLICQGVVLPRAAAA